MNLEPIGPLQTRSHLHSFPRLLLGAMYGFLIGITIVMTAAIVNKLLYPDLPLGMDWSLFVTRALLIVPGLALIGAVTSLFREAIPGLLAGAVITGLLALGSALSSSYTEMGLKILVLVFTLLPIAAMSLPVTLILRWLVDKHEQALELGRVTQIISLIVFAIVLGAGSGFFLKMSPRSVQATRFMDQLLQTAPQDAKGTIRNLPGFQEHASADYQLFQKTSKTSTEGFEVSAVYEDGYSIQCTVVVYPSRDPYVSNCTSEDK